jgi:hypothetical protein
MPSFLVIICPPQQNSIVIQRVCSNFTDFSERCIAEMRKVYGGYDKSSSVTVVPTPANATVSTYATAIEVEFGSLTLDLAKKVAFNCAHVHQLDCVFYSE